MKGIAIAALLLCATAASADDRSVAREHYIKASKAFDLGLYDEAITEYMAAYKAKDDPALLFNLAQSHRLAGHAAEALRFYRVYLLKNPNTRYRDEVQEKIVELQRLVDQQKKTQQMPPDHVIPLTPQTASSARPVEKPAPPPTAEKPATTPEANAATTPTPPPTAEKPATTPEANAATTPTPPPAAENPPPTAAITETQPESHPGRTKKIAGIAIAAVGVAALVAGIGLSVAAKNAGDDLTALDQSHGMFDADKQSSGKTFDAAGTAMLAIGGVAIVAGVVVAVLGWREAKRARAQAVTGSTGWSFGW
jgi:outer membrane biosynthesis protein TonB